MSSLAEDALLIGPPIPHSTNGASTMGTNVTNFSATSAASYVTSGAGSNTTDLSSATFYCCRFVTVNNLSTDAVMYVNVGNTLAIPPDPTAGSFPIQAGDRYTFQIPSGGAQKGAQGYVKVLSSAASKSGSIQWHE